MTVPYGQPDWNPTVPDRAVRLRDNPGRRGVTTGRTRTSGTFLLVEVVFGPNERQWKAFDLLEPSDPGESLEDLIRSGRFGRPEDLRRILTLEKIKGRLTNVFYSMESSNTNFYPHQFKPVLKFIESPNGRLLIADEVGLGKTIEAIYVWKEMQAREDARRLLIICPAMLRPKWRDDLLQRFGLDSEIVETAELLRRLRSFRDNGSPHSFVLIGSLEGLRPPRNYEDTTITSPRAEIARLFDSMPATDERALLDLVIIDEAHYLRNSATQSNLLGRLAGEAARSLLLLTATPIQTASENLYQLLRLVNPEEFFEWAAFSDLLVANGPIVRAQRAVWRNPPDIEIARAEVESAAASDYFLDNPLLSRARELLGGDLRRDRSARVQAARLLEATSLLARSLSRSRKRDVLEARVERSAQTLNVRFKPVERRIYEVVTDLVRQRCRTLRGVPLFSVIARQRQMASSMPAALAAWETSGFLSELLWEDMGQAAGPESTFDLGLEIDAIFRDLAAETRGRIAAAFPNGCVDLPLLEAADSKYDQLRDFLRRALRRSRTEKFVVFAFYRATLQYLARRLTEDGIDVALLMGDMGDRKWNVIETFRQTDGPSVLLSSEVGSEGIDLQFCRFIVNYDLPWNPMKVEQRIGRLDRLGQSAQRISIVNLVLSETIEDRILMRLYNRIAIFQESIGDLEDILGQVTERLLEQLFDPDLSNEERERQAEDTANALVMDRAERGRLESEAINLLAFSDFILDSVRESHDMGRWLGPDELSALVVDFFRLFYPGSLVGPSGHVHDAWEIRLSDEARVALQLHIESTRPAIPTRLCRTAEAVTCIFDARQSHRSGSRLELIGPTHPLIQWIRAQYEQGTKLHPLSIVRLPPSEGLPERGLYAFVAHRWTFKGLRNEARIAYAAAPVGSDSVIEPAVAERLVTAAAQRGRETLTSHAIRPTSLLASVEVCNKHLFDTVVREFDTFQAENASRCRLQEMSARRYTERRAVVLEERIARFRTTGKDRMIPATEGLLRSARDDLARKLAKIMERQIIDHSVVELAAGIIDLR